MFLILTQVSIHCLYLRVIEIKVLRPPCGFKEDHLHQTVKYCFIAKGGHLCTFIKVCDGIAVMNHGFNRHGEIILKKKTQL